MLNQEKIQSLPNTTGVYLLKNLQGNIIYIGKALRLRDRLRSYTDKNLLDSKTLRLVAAVDKIDYLKVNSEVEALILEANLIKKYQPHFNISLKDDKSFLYIVITKEDYPRVLATRKNQTNIKLKKSFGPFPSSSAVRSVLKLIRKIVPYCTQKLTGKRPCFYSHLNLCNPCPGYIIKQGESQKKYLTEVYQENISKINKILTGNINLLIKNLTQYMNSLAETQRFEEAQAVKIQIMRLEYITKPYSRLSTFLRDENFHMTEYSQSTTELLSVLQKTSTDYQRITELKKIECVDIATLMGGQSTGSLVVFVNGLKDPSLYKKFKIKHRGINDVSMIQEVLKRRLKHADWEYPDLFIIDGGKPQVSQARKIVSQFAPIPVIGIAKRLEQIVLTDQNRFHLLSLSRHTRALKLVQEMRDEAHRFARSYHHHLRHKILLNI